jgi:transcriptional regulator with XRE-family HTH domain
MTSLSDIAPLTPEQRAEYGIARAKSIAFDAVHELWRRRRAEGKTQADLAKALGKDEGWLSKNLRGPGNWTIKTLGELVEALDGDLEIVLHALEDHVPELKNYHAYAGYEINMPAQVSDYSVRTVGPIVWETTVAQIDTTPSDKNAPVQITIGSGK